jgi:hypothetical protein
MSGRFYVYSHIRKTDKKCFYIGKGTGRRAWYKLDRNQHWYNTVNKHGFETIILVNNISEEKAFELEASFCKQIGYENLVNINQEKGNGAWTRSEETKEKLRKPKPKGFGKLVAERNSKPVQCIELNKIFKSVVIASKKLKINPRSITNNIHGRSKSVFYNQQKITFTYLS